MHLFRLLRWVNALFQFIKRVIFEKKITEKLNTLNTAIAIEKSVKEIRKTNSKNDESLIQRVCKKNNVNPKVVSLLVGANFKFVETICPTQNIGKFVIPKNGTRVYVVVGTYETADKRHFVKLKYIEDGTFKRVLQKKFKTQYKLK